MRSKRQLGGSQRDATVGVHDLAASRGQRGRGRVAGDVDPAHPGRQVVVDGHREALRRAANDGQAGLDRAAAVLDQQLGDTLGGRGLQLGVDAALVALGRLGRQLVPADAAPDGGRVEVRGLDDDVGGVLVDLDVGGAHHAGDADRAVVVGDEQVVGVEGADDVVERGDLLAGLGPADDDVAMQLGAVVGVVGLAELEHDVVAHVDGERDRAHAGLLDAAGHPGGSRTGRVEPGDRAGDEDRASGGVVDPDRVAVPVGRDLDLGRVGERHAEREGGVAGDAAERERVRAVGVDLELDHVLVQAEQRGGVVAGLGSRPRAR